MDYTYAIQRRDEAFMVIESSDDVTQDMIEEYQYWAGMVGNYRNPARSSLWI